MRSNCTLILCGLAASMSWTLAVWGQHDAQSNTRKSVAAEQSPTITPDAAQARLLIDNPGARFFELDGRITRVYGTTLSTGQSPHDSADQFRMNHSRLWNVPPEDLVARGPFADGRHLQPIKYVDGQYVFTGVYYSQQRGGVDVFRSHATMLTRNEPGYPLVLVSSNLRDLGNFMVDQVAVGDANAAAGVTEARKSMPADAVFTQGKTVIFAGVDGQPYPATLGVVFEGEGGNPLNGDYSKRLFVTDAATGAVLYSESLVHDVNVTGQVQINRTEGFGADICGNESPAGMPYALLQISGGNSAFADVNGNFNITNAGSANVTLNSAMQGQYFVVNNTQGANTISQVVTPGTPVNLLHNAANASEFYRADVNSYLHANVVRDTVLAYNPSFPTIATQTNFPVNTNINLTCNAFYNGSSINFYIQGGSCGINTGFGTVVHHEYGHHVSNVSGNGSGGGAYGEGHGDVMGILCSDSAITGMGWGGSCAGGLRTANNNCQYQTSGCSSCGSEAHSCGQLISGCVWSLRNALAASDPSTYRQILGDLAINAMLIHGNTTIAPDITIDYLTIDDDDADLGNGTPHRNQIAAAFGAHNMPAPALPLAFTYPLGRPEFISSTGGTVLRVIVGAADANPAPGATLNINTGSGFTPTAMTLVGPNTYEAAFPAATCGSAVRYYVSAQTTGAVTVTSPATAPTAFFNAYAGNGFGAVAFTDNFQTNQGWTVATTAADGPWERAVPVPLSTCNRGNPGSDADGSGFCYVTDNSTASACNSDVDTGATVLTSPNMDATGGPSVLSYWRWYSNSTGGAPNADTFVVEISSNGGTNWQNLETVGPVTESNGGWFFKQWSLSAIPGFALTNQFRVRFTAQDVGTGSVVEAGVDGVALQRLNCGNAVGDVNGDGNVDVDDLIAVILAWGPCPAPPTACPADTVPNGQVDVDDLIAVILNWG